MVAIPTLFLVFLAVFTISKSSPGDPVEEAYGRNPYPTGDPEAEGVIYRGKAALLGLDMPVFFLSITTAAYPDTFWKIYPLDRRQKLAALLEQTGNWNTTRRYDASLNAALRLLPSIPDTLPAKANLRLQFSKLETTEVLEFIPPILHQADSIVAGFASPQPQMALALDSLQTAFAEMQNMQLPYKRYIPAIHWYGRNQFSHWMGALLSGNWGITKFKKPVWPEVRVALYCTMAINLVALALAYLIAVPLGVEMARRRGKKLDRWGKRALFFLSAMPVFWMGGILAIFLTSNVFGRPLVPSPYLSVSDYWAVGSESFFHWFLFKIPKFILPITVLTLYALAIISVQMRGGMLETLGQDYIRTARAKGVDENKVIWKHAFRNALFPIITIFGSLFPALFTGSLVVETMFSYPGIGLKTQKAFETHDLSVLSFILISAAVLTILGNLIADILYAVADPRVRFSRD